MRAELCRVPRFAGPTLPGAFSMNRGLVASVALAALAAGGLTSLARADQTPAVHGLRAGVAAVDATWHVGAGAGQYASDPDPQQGLSQEWDPNFEHVKQ